MDSFKGRRVLITGGAKGIGHACAQTFADLAAEVHVLDIAAPEEAVEDVHYHDGDLRSQSSVEAVLQQVQEISGGLDLLVNNAGVSFVGGVETGTDEEWHWLWDINVLGFVRATRAALPLLRQASAPAIVNMSSCTATSGLRQRVLYSATKGAVESMTRAMAADLVAEGITVNAVNPGTVDTPFMSELAARAEDPALCRRQFEERQPTGRMVAPREVAQAVAFLAHPTMRSTVGSTIIVDGGMAGLHITEA
ncbi:SDR family NAD(P)-dependent oxidoreductase [Nesterenkonia ebinurensis]|uniref:SDR family NAD(P)-dependent oxidoreductase n=1 Tax=Nesterenkonia ebinurensis TaxID=2608252 RepID=UPI00123D4E43|nr:SDR family oxidoreductase [Nesterenkonia ebinurensis]